MKKIVSILLAISMLLSVTSVFAAEPESTVLESTKIVNVTGKLTDGGESVNILLLDGGNVKYINEFPVETDGSYRAKFKYEDKIEGLTLSVKQGEADVTGSVVSAVSDKEAVVYELDAVNSPINTEVIAKIENHYNVTGKAYQVVVAYYDANNKLQNVIINDKTVEEGLNIFAEDFKIPDDAKKIKVFMWDSVKTMIPLAKSVEAKDTIRVLAIGNSYAVDAFEYLDDIAAAEGVNLELRIAQIGGATFTTHWNAWTAETPEGRNRYYENDVKYDIAHFLEDGSRYDYITIQQSSANSGDVNNYMNDAENVVKYIREKQPTAEILIHKTWANEKGSPVDAFVKTYNSDQAYMTEQIDKCVENARIELGKVKTASGLEVSPGGKPLRYIPSGDAVVIARQSKMFDTEYTGEAIWDDVNKYSAPEDMEWKAIENNEEYISLHRDSYHCSRRFGRYLVALVWYRCLTGNSVANNTYTHSMYPITDEGRAIINAAAEKAVVDSGIWD